MSALSIVTVTNQKGGVGKTTTVLNWAAALAERKKRVLCVDLDYQGNLSRSFGLKSRAKREGRTVTRAVEKSLTLEDVRLPADHPNIHVVCADLSLVYLIQQLTGRPRQASVLRRILDCDAVQEYDVILVDTHPSPDCLFQSAIAACHYYLLPVFAEPDPLEGVQYMIQLVDEVKEEYNPNLTFLGVLITRYSKRNKTHERFQPLLRNFAKRRNFNVFQTVIPQSDAVAAASASQTPVLLDSSKTALPISHSYRDFATEVAPQLRGRRHGRKPLSPNFEGVEILDDAFDEDVDITVATQSIAL